jgi:hypothetical protein
VPVAIGGQGAVGGDGGSQCHRAGR